MPNEKKQKKVINLALQGGGSHGAFTWGVLDALLEDGRLDFEGISATSAGAMNAAMLAYGKARGGRDGAREVLEDFWRGISSAGGFFRPYENIPYSNYFSAPGTPFSAIMKGIQSSFSPYDLNPLNINPLRHVLETVIEDISIIHKCDLVKLFITATDVRSGTSKVFENKDMSIDALLASSCLPQLFQAVEIDGEAYWDGGYMGNPSLWPLFYNARCRDILLVHINPVNRQRIPQSAQDIEERLNEITFNAALLKELRAIDFVKKLITDDMLKDEYKEQYKDILLHAIRTDTVIEDLGAESKANTEWSFLLELKEMGREEAKKWLKENYDLIGKKTNVDIKRDYLSKL